MFIYNGGIMAIGCFILAAVYVFRFHISRVTETLIYKRWAMLWKAINWSILGLAYLYVAIYPAPAPMHGLLIQFAVGMVVLAELSYHGDIISTAVDSLRDKIRLQNESTKIIK